MLLYQSKADNCLGYNNMQVYIIIIVLVSLYQNVHCGYKLAWVQRDFKKSYNSLYKYISENLTKLKLKVKNYIYGSGTKKMVRFDEQQIDAGSRKAFKEFVGNKWNSGEVDKSESVQLATPQLALWHGRNMESHVVETKDGYFLTLHRVVIDHYVSNRTILLHHGLLGSSTDWILGGPRNSLPYILADAGYDVWIANARGNYYSRGHISLTVDFSNYWNFSWQEMGEYDLPAIIDYIRHVKKSNESINFVGHSMGATALLVLLSTAPQYNEYLRMGILLAPLAYMSNIEGPLQMMSTVSEKIINMMGDGEFLPNRKVPSWLANKYCWGSKSYCRNPLLFLSGIPQDKKWTPSFIARLLYHVPAGGSLNTILHYIQLARSGKFHKFNDKSFEFPVNNITLPLALFSSTDDWLATVPNVLKLFFFIQNPIDHHIIRGRNVTHTDFVWGTEARRLVFNKVLDYLEDGFYWNSIKANELK